LLARRALDGVGRGAGGARGHRLASARDAAGAAHAPARHLIMPLTNLQIFGTKKCPDTRKAERWFKERRVSFQLIDLAQKGPSPGELRKIANAVGGVEKLIDREGKRYVDRGLKYAAHTGPRIEQTVL